MRLTASPALPGSLPGTERRPALAAVTRQAALLAFAGAVILSPFRARFILDERPLPGMFPDYTNLLLFWNEILILAALGLWATSLLLQPRRLDFGPLPLRLPALVLAAAICLSVPMAESRAVALFNAVTLLGFLAFALFVLNEVKSAARLAPVIAAMIAVQATVAMTQVVSQQPFGLGALGEMELDVAVPSVSILWTEEHGALLRGYGMSDHPNILGGVLAASLLVLGAGFARFRGDRFALLCGVFGVGVAALFVTFSRSAALGFAAGAGAALLLHFALRDWRTLRLWAVACLVAAIVTLPLVKAYTPYIEARANPGGQPVASPEDRAVSERLAQLRQTGEIFAANPLAGVGVGVLPIAMWNAYPDFEYTHGPAHIVIAVVAAETGILGAAAYGALVLAPWFLLWRHSHRLTPELIGVSCALLALLVISMLDYYTWSLNAGRIWFWLVLALWVVAFRNATGRHADG